MLHGCQIGIEIFQRNPGRQPTHSISTLASSVWTDLVNRDWVLDNICIAFCFVLQLLGLFKKVLYSEAHLYNSSE